MNALTSTSRKLLNGLLRKLYISFPFAFADKEHQEFFADALHEIGTTYPPYVAAIYLLSATPETRDRFWNMVDLDGNFVNDCWDYCTYKDYTTDNYFKLIRGETVKPLRFVKPKLIIPDVIITPPPAPRLLLPPHRADNPSKEGDT